MSWYDCNELTDNRRELTFVVKGSGYGKSYAMCVHAFNRDFDCILDNHIGEHADDYDLEQLRDELYWACIDQAADGAWLYRQISTGKLNAILSACDKTADPADEQPLSKELQNIRACYEDFCDYMDDCGMGDLYRSMMGRQV